MDINQTQIDGIVEANVVAGTDYRSGVTAGDFQTPGAFTNRGVGIGNARPYSFFPHSLNDVEVIINYVVTAPGYIPIGDNLINGVTTASIVDSQLVLDVPRCITVLDPTSTGTITVSGYEYYGRKMVTAGGITDQELDSPTIPRPYRSITSIYVELDTYPGNVAIAVTPYFDFPYTNNGSSMNIIAINTDSGPFIVAPPSGSLPYLSTFYFNGVDKSALNPDPTQPQTLTTNLLRPVFGLGLQGIVTTTPPITIWAAIPNISFSLDPNTITKQAPFPNDLELVIGVQPYSDGWTDWQG